MSKGLVCQIFYEVRNLLKGQANFVDLVLTYAEPEVFVEAISTTGTQIRFMWKGHVDHFCGYTHFNCECVIDEFLEKRNS